MKAALDKRWEVTVGVKSTAATLSFDELLVAMLGVPASRSQPSDTAASDVEHVEGCDDIQTPKDISEDAS